MVGVETLKALKAILCFHRWYDEKIVLRAEVIYRRMFDNELEEVTWLVMGEHFVGQHRHLECYSFLYWEPMHTVTETCS